MNDPGEFVAAGSRLGKALLLYATAKLKDCRAVKVNFSTFALESLNIFDIFLVATKRNGFRNGLPMSRLAATAFHCFSGNFTRILARYGADDVDNHTGIFAPDTFTKIVFFTHLQVTALTGGYDIVER